LPRVDPRRSLSDMGGLLLMHIFGTATVTDIHLKHEIDELQQRNYEIAHLVSNQVTYKGFRKSK